MVNPYIINSINNYALLKSSSGVLLYTGETIYKLHKINYRWILNLNVKSAELLKILERPVVSEFGKFGDISPHATT